MKTHIPDFGSRSDRTFCGRSLSKVPCIDTKRDLIDSATCKRCHAVDDARALAEYRLECRAAGKEL